MVRFIVMIFGLFLLLSFIGCNKTSQVVIVTQMTLNEEQVTLAKKLLDDRCTKCHDLKRVDEEKADLKGWTKYVDSMIEKGANLNSDERVLLINYLAIRQKGA